MAHHRCTRCKQESYPRHKYQGGVYCDDCMRWIKGYRYTGRGRSWIGSIWDRVTDFFGGIFHPESPKHLDRDKERASHARLKAMEAKARNIPYDPQCGVPGKH